MGQINRGNAPSDPERIMNLYAERTGLTGTKTTPDRYLWTDAFAVCNFLGLYLLTNKRNYLDLARELVDQVHHVLGKHRRDDERTGWISGLDPEEGEKHPTQGGLRIGKELNERKPAEVYDEELEWNRDGQYFHYLTKWMHALSRMTRVTGESNYLLWAIELAKTVHNRFVYAPQFGGGKRLYWKMNITLTNPLVSSMGHHDPLDGLITYLELENNARYLSVADNPDLSDEIIDMREICSGKDWTTDDPLGLGGLIADIFRLVQIRLMCQKELDSLLQRLIEDADEGMKQFAGSNFLGYPAEYRLAFRELGLCIGLKAIPEIKEHIRQNSGDFANESAWKRRIESLGSYQMLTDRIENFWGDLRNQAVSSWKSHQNINMVMLATCLAPDSYLKI
jgi:hypothetical protein